MSILVTGGTKGIGLAIARRFAKPGIHVFLNYHADDDAALKAQAELNALGSQCHLVKGDVGTPEGARSVLAGVAAHTDRLDHLVHSAVRPMAEPLLTVDAMEFTKAINLNGTALLYLVQAAIPLFRRGSSILFISSRGGRTPSPNFAAIGVAKSLAESLIRYLVLELAPLGVRANCIAPMRVDTDSFRAFYGERADTLLQQSAAENPSGRNVAENDFCSMAEFLASPAAEMIQGQVIFVSGGAYLAA